MRPLSGKELARLLEREGWSLLRIQGSHHIYGKPGSQVRLSVPVHGNQLLKTGLPKPPYETCGDSAGLIVFTEALAGVESDVVEMIRPNAPA